jgi:DNA-binding protein HU-alpha
MTTTEKSTAKSTETKRKAAPKRTTSTGTGTSTGSKAKSAPKTTARKPVAKNTTTGKATTSKTTKPAAVVSEPVAAPVEENAKTASKQLRYGTFVAEVARRSGVRKSEARAAVSAAMELLGETLARSESVNLPGLGKVDVQRIKDKEAASFIIARIRQKKDGLAGEKPAADPLAKAAE